MKTYLVNLDRDTERLAAAKRQLDLLGVEFDRIPAVDGRSLSSDEFRSSYKPFRWWCAMGRPIRPGEVGCAYSHFEIYRRMIRDGIEIACVLEDDVVLEPQFLERTREVLGVADLAKAQVFLLSNHTNGRESGAGVCRSMGDRHTEGYVITRVAAKALLTENCPMITPCDFWDRWVRKNVIELYHAFPSVCSPNERDFVSNIAPKGVYDVRNMNGLQLVFHKARRAMGLLIDRLLLIIGL